MPDFIQIKNFYLQLQDSICQALENVDGKAKFREDKWEHTTGGGGRTRVIANGNILEKGGVNFSAVEGVVSEPLRKHFQINKNLDFLATGVSIVLHPYSPMIPIIHMNVRYFEMSDGQSWFGGGIDLTPHYIDKEDAGWFHYELKKVCDLTNPSFYPSFKVWADNYFYIPHRNETRGVGGIFFDYLRPSLPIPYIHATHTKKQLFVFSKNVGLAFAPIYTYLMQKNADLPYSEGDKKWQYVRRGRYAEFNLVIDRGTKFGLETKGRTESILMSLPPRVEWDYNFDFSVNPKAVETQALLRKGVEWI